MKRVPFEESKFTRVFEDPAEASKYAAHHAGLARRAGRRFAAALSDLGFEKGRVLDAGSGSGDTAMELAAAFPQATVLGLDLSEPLLAMARTSARAAGLAHHVSFIKGNVQSMPFEDDSFDCVVSFNTLHVTEDPAAMINECERVLTADGTLLVSTIRRSWLGWLIPVLKTSFTVAEAEKLLIRSKLRPWKIHVGFIWLNIEASKLRACS